MNRRTGLLLPLFLIVVGVLALLSTLGVIRLDVWELWRLWPLILVLLGLDLVLRRTRGGTVIFAVIALVLAGGAVALVLSSTSRYYAEPSTGSVVLTQALLGADEASVSIEFGRGRLEIEALTDSANLMEGEFEEPDGRYRAVKQYRVADGLGVLTIRSEEAGLSAAPWRSGDGAEWAVALNGNIPLSLAIDMGAGEAVLHLSELKLAELDVNGGVGRVEVWFPDAAGQTSADVDVGVGDVALFIPEGVAARIDIDRGLGDVDVAERFRREGDYYVSDGYPSALNRLDLEVQGGVGSIIIE